MNPMETMAISMLSKLTGMTPEQMQEMAVGGLNTIKNAEERLTKIEQDITIILKFIEEMTKDYSNGK